MKKLKNESDIKNAQNNLNDVFESQLHDIRILKIDDPITNQITLPELDDIIKEKMESINAIQNDYHKYHHMPTDNFKNNFVKIDANAPDDCNDDVLKNQAATHAQNTKFIFQTQYDKPDPKVFEYTWPSFYLGAYTKQWHTTDGGTI